jgi:hypothetical protein
MSTTPQFGGGAMTITLTTGQPIRWKPSASGIAQIDELRRSCVRVVYRTKRGTLRFRVVHVSKLNFGDVLPFPDPFNRGSSGLYTKTFTLPARNE